MSWEKILKDDFADIDNFIKNMKTLNLAAQKEFKKFETEPSLEMKRLHKAISEMGWAIISLEEMRKRQGQLQ